MAGFRGFLERQIESAWYGDARWSRGLKLLVPLYRRAALKEKVRGQIAAQNSPLEIPVVVVGNITAGGTGKSPVVIKLARDLQSKGYKPGILSRGYGAQAGEQSCRVTDQDSPKKVGDEPLMMATSLMDLDNLSVVVDRDRARGARYLQAECGADVVICDDGLQHYGLPRDIEIIILDAKRGTGNGLLIPAGPLRESEQRLESVDFVLSNGSKAELSENLQAQVDDEFSVRPKNWRNLISGENLGLDNAPVQGKVLAVSAIGNPGRFHRSLESLGLEPVAKVFPDHHAFSESDFSFGKEEADLPLVMTAKDAVKCREFAIRVESAKTNWWVLEVEADLPQSFLDDLTEKLSSVKEHKKKRAKRGIN